MASQSGNSDGVDYRFWV